MICLGEKGENAIVFLAEMTTNRAACSAARFGYGNLVIYFVAQFPVAEAVR